MSTQPMNSQKPHWELKLSSLHVVVLIGLICGSMVAAFYMGFLSGERVGFDSGQEVSLAHTARIPIPESETEGVNDGSISEDVYDQLAAAPNPRERANSDELPALGKIEAAPAVSHDNSMRDFAGEAGVLAESDDLIQKMPSARDAAKREVPGANDRDFHPFVSPQDPQKSAATREKDGQELTLGALDEPQSVTMEDGNGGKATVTIKSQGQLPGKLPIAIPTAVPTAKIVAAPIATLPPVRPTVKPTVIAVESTKGLIRSVLPKGWYAQVAAPKKLADAEKMAGKLKSSGFSVIIERANVRGEDYFRVVVGPEKDRTKVDRLIDQVKREGFEPFPRAVK